MDINGRLETISNALCYVRHVDLNIQVHPQMIHCKELLAELIKDLKKERTTALADFAAEIFDIFYLDYTYVKLRYNRHKEHDSETLGYAVNAILQYFGNEGMQPDDEKRAFTQALKWRLEYKKLKEDANIGKIDE